MNWANYLGLLAADAVILAFCFQILVCVMKGRLLNTDQFIPESMFTQLKLLRVLQNTCRFNISHVLLVFARHYMLVDASLSNPLLA